MRPSPEAPRGGSPLHEPPALSDDERARRLRDPARLAALANTELMDAAPEEAFDRFTRLAARLLGAPTALVSLVDDKRQFFKSALGLSGPVSIERGTPLTHSFCQHVVATSMPLIVTDARRHALLRNNRATTELDVVAYAGVPLMTSDKQVLGALCVVDSKPRTWSPEDLEALHDLAAMTMTEIELRGRLKALRAAQLERDKDQRLLGSIVDCMADSVVVHDKHGNIVMSNTAAQRNRPTNLTTAGSFVSGGAFEADGVTPLALERAPASRASRGEQVQDQVIATQFPEHPLRYYSVNAAPLRDGNDAVYATVTVARDVTVARANEHALARSEAVLRNVMKCLPNSAVLLFDHDLRYLAADGEQLLSGVGLAREALIGRTLQDIASPQGLLVAEPHYRAALAGETRDFEISRNGRHYAATIVPVRDPDGTISAGLVMVYDITSHKRQEQAARDEAEQSRAVSMKDELTQLCNRRGFLDLARKQLAVAHGLQRPALLFFVDLNGMKQINDQLGHETGDAALVEMADVLRATFRGSDVLARLGGDEFVALLLDAGEGQIEHFSKRIQSELEQRNDRGERQYVLSASVGGAVYDPSAPESIDTLLARADALMYEQKKQRKSQRF